MVASRQAKQKIARTNFIQAGESSITHSFANSKSVKRAYTLNGISIRELRFAKIAVGKICEVNKF